MIRDTYITNTLSCTYIMKWTHDPLKNIYWRKGAHIKEREFGWNPEPPEDEVVLKYNRTVDNMNLPVLINWMFGF